MAAAIIELDALADAVRTAAEDHHLLAIGGTRLVIGLAVERSLVGRIHVGGGRGELGRRGVDALIDRPDAERLAQRPHVLGLLAGEIGEAAIGKAHRLEAAQRFGRIGQAELAHLVLGYDQAVHLLEEPRVDLRRIVDVFEAHAEPHGFGDMQQALRGRGGDGGEHRILVVVFRRPGNEARDADLVEAGKPGFERAQRLLQRFLEGAADGHGLADRLHRSGQAVVGARELLEGEARDLGDDIVDRRLERGRGGAAGDVVLEFVEGVADGEAGGDLGDREAGGLRCQRRRARDARVHLDDDHPAIGRVDGELHVRTAGLDADLAQHGDRGVAHDLVFLVGQRQGRRDSDGIAGMDAHRIDVLDRADDDAVVVAIAHHLHLVLFPAEHAFLDQHLVGGRGVDAGLDDGEIFFLVVGDAAAGAAKGKAGADDAGQADHLERLQRFDGVVRQHGAGGLEPDLLHGVAEQLTVLGLVDGLGVGADHLDVELVEDAHLLEAERAVERGLAAHGGEQRVRALLLDDLGDDLGGDRLDIGGVGEIGIGHDRRRVGVHQDDPVTLVLERLACLGAGIVELAGLSDDDRTRTDDEDRFDVGAFWHLWSLLVRRLRCGVCGMSRDLPVASALGARGKTRVGAGLGGRLCGLGASCNRSSGGREPPARTKRVQVVAAPGDQASTGQRFKASAPALFRP